MLANLTILKIKYNSGMNLYLLIFLVTIGLFGMGVAVRRFPSNFRFGTATASHQVEGGWNTNGKGENIWDRLTHTTNLVVDGSNGDIACDSYHKYKRDVEMLKELGVDFYRFSLSWSRIMPYGRINYVSPDGIRYYNDLINELIANGIEPVVTLYHWDLPQKLQDLGGWTNSLIIDYFVDYAGLAYEAFGDRVKMWLTFNEPTVFCLFGYAGLMAPSINMSGIGDYICGHNMIRSQAKAYRLYDEKFRPTQSGKVSFATESYWLEPDENTSLEHADDAMQFELGWWANPIYSRTGDYPNIMKQRIYNKSIEQGFLKSRLPEFTSEEIEYIKGSSDFFALNHYSSAMVKANTDEKNNLNPSFWDDTGSYRFFNNTWPRTLKTSIRVVPWGLTKLLVWIKRNYDNPEIMMVENGFSDMGGLQDVDRKRNFHLYLNALLDAIDQGANVVAYTAWSLMDTFEWLSGYSVRYGLYEVDFEDPNRTRTPKASAFFYRDIIANHAIDEIFTD